MGAILYTGLFLTGAMIAFEIYIVRSLTPAKYQELVATGKTSWLSRLLLKPLYQLGPFIEKSPVNGIIWSVGLSMAAGAMFPATGIMVLIAGITSSIAVQPYYMARRRWAKVKAKHAERVAAHTDAPTFTASTIEWVKAKMAERRGHTVRKPEVHIHLGDGESFS